MASREERVKLSERGAWVSIIVYIILALVKAGSGLIFNSAALLADGLNNFTDTISSIAVLIGLKTARKPADDYHPYGHWKAEPIASLVTSFIMLFLGLQLLISAITSLIRQEVNQPPSNLAAIISLLAMLVLLAVAGYNRKIAIESSSFGLEAVSKDNLNDALTSLATALAIFTSSLNLAWLDQVMAIVIALIILKTGIGVFKQSSFALSDGFDDSLLQAYHDRISQLEEVQAIPQLKARMYGANIYVDCTILVQAQMTVQESHDITEVIEKILYEEFDVMHTDVHVEPHNIQDQFSDEQM